MIQKTALAFYRAIVLFTIGVLTGSTLAAWFYTTYMNDPLGLKKVEDDKTDPPRLSPIS